MGKFEPSNREKELRFRGVRMSEDEDFPQCCFCKEKYLSEVCRECPARDEPMPDEVEEED